MQITKERIKADFEEKLTRRYAIDVAGATKLHQYIALGRVIKDYISECWKNSKFQYNTSHVKQVYYFSLEFLTGKFLDTNLINLGIKDICREALAELGVDLAELESLELEQGLGNGGLGRLAACFMDSMSSACIPAMGMGIRYRYGLFKQKFVDGYQVEISDDWLKNENVWEVRREDESCEVKFGGNVHVWGNNGKYDITYQDYETVLAVPYDTPYIGYHNNNVNPLRLWKAEVVDDTIDYSSFSKGDYAKAIEKKYNSEIISQILYPDDSNQSGKILRLRQEYFFVSAGCQSVLKRFKRYGLPLSEMPNYVAIQINDTHPALVIPELMRLLMDEEHLEWEPAWEITRKTVAYTNHTILAEALEKWDVSMVQQQIPRVYMIIEEIDRRFREKLKQNFVNDWGKIESMAIISQGKVKMAHLAIEGSFSVNGVAKLHTEILKNTVLKDFYDLYPHKFNNKTNGITHRRWLISANPKLADLICENIGDGWVTEPEKLEQFADFADNSVVGEAVESIKHENKVLLSNFILDHYGISVDPNSIFQTQIKRLHGYKRQLLNILQVIDLYNQLKQNPNMDIFPQTFLFGAKAYPSYTFAKAMIKLINTVALKINTDMSIHDKLKVVFMENYNVDLAQKIIPASDTSIQISTASKEASGTGNMKLMMNGAVTIATMDGANIEIHDAVGPDNIIIFGLSSEEVLALYSNRTYHASDMVNSDYRLNNILNQLKNGYFDVNNNEFSEIINQLYAYNDEYFVLKDFPAYVNAQESLRQMYADRPRWQHASIINIAQSGHFSSDNTIRNYANEIWKIPPFSVK